MQVTTHTVVQTSGLPARGPGVLPETRIHTVCGCEAVLRMQPVLEQLSERCRQQGAMDDLPYFLSKPGALKRTPYLLLILKDARLSTDSLTADDLVGAVLLYQYRVMGCSIRMYTSNDRSGRGTLVAPAPLRAAVAEKISRELLSRGALAVLISFQNEEIAKDVPPQEVSLSAPAGDDRIARWAWREREIPGYLPLERTFDATLAGIGQRTRRNMRYYRKRAEAELGCTFQPEVKIGRQEFLAFNGECMYAVPDRVAAWRYDSLRDLETPLFVGMKDKDGRWLSMLGGRRHHGETEILWQMNRDGLSVYSLSLVMRSYFMEQEIAHGMKRLCTEGGTPHPMRFSFVTDKVTDLVCLRRLLLLLPVHVLAKRLIKPDNELAHMLMDKSLYMRSAEKSRQLGRDLSAASATAAQPVEESGS